MSESRFYSPREFLVGDSVELDTEQSRHALKSRRLKPGDLVELLNGVGQTAVAEITSQSSRSAAVLKIRETSSQQASNFDLTIAVAVPKGDRQKTMLDMLAQLGVSRIVPINCKFSSIRANDKLIDKWHRQIIESSKQSGRAWFPKIESPVDVLDYCVQANNKGAQLLLADPKGEPWREYCSSVKPPETVVCMVGPEGGFSETEVESMLTLGARGVSFSPNILRVETAAVAIASLLLNR